MNNELKTDGKDIAFVVIAMSGGEASQAELVSRVSFPLFQDTAAVNAWAQHAGGKDDIIVYDTSGKVAQFLPSSTSTNLSDATAYAAVKALIANTK
jgi:hypothetical protein